LKRPGTATKVLALHLDAGIIGEDELVPLSQHDDA
jgi:hypothetical protein